jgi:hypothetical protein
VNAPLVHEWEVSMRAVVTVTILLMGLTAHGPVGAACPELSGRVSHGPAMAVSVSSYLALYGSGAHLMVANISNPTAPEVVADLQLTGIIRGIVAAGSYAYVAADTGGLQIIDLSVPAQPSVIATWADTVAQDVAIRAGHAYVADLWQGLRVVDISSPESPVEIASLDTPGFPSGLDLSATTVYLADGSGGFRIIDVTDPGTPIELGWLATPGSAYDVAVSANHAYVADSNGGLRVIDIANPGNPIEVGAEVSFSAAQEVVVAGPYAYVAAGGSGLKTVDISDPTSPVVVGSIITSEQAYDLALSNNHVLVAYGEDGLKLYDISDISNPTEVANLDTPGRAKMVAVDNGHAYIADANEGLRIIDISDPAHPRQVGANESMGWAGGIAVSGDYAYVASTVLRVVDVSQPSMPTEVGQVGLQGMARGVAVSGSYVLVAAQSSGLRVVDVSDPTAPTEVAALATVDLANGVSIAGDHAYVAINAEGLQIFDISEPTQPIAISRIDTSAYAQSVTADESYAYVSDYWGGLHIIDVSDPEQPAEVSTYDPSGFVFASAICGRLAVVANGDLGLKVISISNPAEISEIGEISTTGDAVWVTISGARLVVAEDRAGVGVYDISDCAGFGVPEADFTWTPELPMAGEEIQLTDTSQGLVTSWSWSFDDGAISHQQNPRHTFSAGGTYRVSLTVGGPGGSDTFTRKIEVLSAGGEAPPVIEAGEYVTVIAGAAHAYGLEGTIWVTDVVVHNPGDAPAIFHLYYLEGGHANLGAVGHSFMVAGQTSLRLPDVIFEVFAKEGSGGALLIGSDQPLIVSSRTYNEQPLGSYGQYIPGLDIGLAVDGGQEVRLIQLAYSPEVGVGFRTNIGWVNLGTSNISVTARLFLGDGAFIGSKSYTIQPYGYFQRSNIFHQLSDVPIDDAYAIVTADDPQARFLTYASVVDNRSGDPVYIQPGRVIGNH